MPTVHCCSEVALAHLMPLSVYSASSLKHHEVVSACKVGTHELWLERWRVMLGIHLLSGASVLTARCCSEVTLARLMPCLTTFTER